MDRNKGPEPIEIQRARKLERRLLALLEGQIDPRQLRPLKRRLLGVLERQLEERRATDPDASLHGEFVRVPASDLLLACNLIGAWERATLGREYERRRAERPRAQARAVASLGGAAKAKRTQEQRERIAARTREWRRQNPGQKARACARALAGEFQRSERTLYPIVLDAWDLK